MENETKMTQTFVRYYVGDLCYVMNDEWDEVCDRFFPPDSVGGVDGEFQLADGRKFFSLSTMYGDGTYRDNFGRAYGVDAGLIGAIKVDDIRDPDFEKVIARGYAHIVEFSSELQDFDVSSNDYGTLRFGPILIETGFGDEEVEEDGDF
jgi:hypothetical protein